MYHDLTSNYHKIRSINRYQIILILLNLIVKNQKYFASMYIFANELSNGKINGVAFLDDLHLPPTVLLMPCNWAFSLKTFCRTCKQIRKGKY